MGKARRVFVFFQLVRVGFQAVGWGGLAGLLQLALTALFSSSAFFLRGAWVLLMGGVLGFLFYSVRRLWATSFMEQAAGKIGGHPQDLLFTAWELTQQKGDDEFKTRALAQAEKAFPSSWVPLLVPTDGFRIGGGAALSLLASVFIVGKTPGPLLQKTLWPFGPTVQGIQSVQPGHLFFPRGEDVVVTVRLSPGEIGDPHLEVRTPGERSDTRPLHFESPGVFSTVFHSLQDPLEYRAVCQSGRSPRFRLTPFDPPKLVRLQARVEPPAYAQIKPEIVQDALYLRVMAGSRIRWSVVLEPRESLLRVDPAPPSIANTGGEWSWTETAEVKSQRRLWARLSNGSADVVLADITLDPRLDAAPQVSVLSPSENGQVDRADRFPIVAEFLDEGGVKIAGISYRLNEGPWVRTQGNPFPRASERELFEQDFDVGNVHPKTGDRIEFFVWARDGRGPAGEGRSETRRLQVIDARVLHERVQEGLEKFQKAMVDRLGEERSVRDSLSVSTPPWAGMITEQRQTARRMALDADHLNALLDQMDDDWLISQEIVWVHQGLEERLRSLIQSDVPKVDRWMVEENLPEAARALDPLLTTLEQLARLSAEALRAESARQLLREQSDLANRAEQLARSLSDPVGLSDEDARRFQEIVQAMQEALERIRERVNHLNKNLSEEELKNATVETLKFDRVSNALERLTRALQQKNGGDAVAAAQEALDQLREMERQLNRVDGSLSSSHAEAEAALTAEKDRLNRLIQRQESLLERTLDVPKETLPPWVDEQSALAEETRALSSRVKNVERQTALLSPDVSLKISTAADAMDGAALSLRSLAVPEAQRQEESALEHLREAQDRISQAIQTLRSLSTNGGGRDSLGRRRPGRAGAEGSTGEVPLPRADDFRPPAAFRQELLDSMKESYPRDQEGPVQDYYRHWTK